MTRRKGAYEDGRLEGIKVGLGMAEKFIAVTKGKRDAEMMIKAALLTLTGKDITDASVNGITGKPAAAVRALRPKRHARNAQGSSPPDGQDRAGD